MKKCSTKCSTKRFVVWLISEFTLATFFLYGSFTSFQAVFSCKPLPEIWLFPNAPIEFRIFIAVCLLGYGLFMAVNFVTSLIGREINAFKNTF